MNKSPIILGIETSCDETAVSIIQDHESGIPKILSNIVSSQVDIHKEFRSIQPKHKACLGSDSLVLFFGSFRFHFRAYVAPR